MADTLVDTDVFIDHVRRARAFGPDAYEACYSTITRAELFAGRGGQDDVITQLLAPFEEFAVDRMIAERAGLVRRETGIRLPDALIAATALVHGLALATRNVRDFGRVPGLRLQL